MAAAFSVANIQFTVVESAAYYKQLLVAVRQAKHRILIAAMAVRSSALTSLILSEVDQAARRGVRVHIIADPYGMSRFGRETHQSAASFKKLLHQTREQLDAIRLHGGEIHWIGHMGFNPFKGRYHAKITVVDDVVFCFGGINFDGTDAIDYMLKTHNDFVADQLWQLALNNIQGLPAHDTTMQLSSQHTLLFDAGIPGKSIIYDRACQLTKAAGKVYYISPMHPSGHLAQLLKATQSICYMVRPAQVGGFTKLAQLWDEWRVGTPNHYEGTAFFHAKCMLFEMLDGTKVVLSGSNNFNWRGVAFGTKEVALQSTDPQLWKSLQNIVFKVATTD